MAIEPNSIIRIFKNVPLDNSYRNTLWFDNETQQKAYFANAQYTLTNQTYQRVGKGTMRVQIKSDDLYASNYLAFQNTSFGNKWFYAFINSVEYVNDITSEITYEIDVMQTYLFDVTLMESFVEREHTSTDNVGDNIIDEGLEIGDYFSEDGAKTNLFDNYTVAMISPYRFVGSNPVKAWTDRVITNNPCVLVNYYYMSSNLDDALARFSADLFALDTDGHSNEIVAVYMLPTGFLEITADFRGKLPTDVVVKSHSYGQKPTSLGGYVPRNKKLLTYPFNKLTITTYSDEKDYAYEYFNTDSIVFNIYGNLTPNTSFKAVPFEYKGEQLNFDEGIVMSDFPLVAYSSDNYAEWLARNKTRIGIQGITGMFLGSGGFKEIAQGSLMRKKSGGVTAFGAKHIAKGLQNVVEDVGGTVADMISQSVAAKTFGSSAQGSTDGSLEIAMGKKDFIYLHKFINPKYAEIIDDYFDMYGYAVRKLKVPNRNVRPHWTYTKTVGCIVKNKNEALKGAPSGVIQDIQNIYDTGITFWKNPSEVGNYSLNNSPS